MNNELKEALEALKNWHSRADPIWVRQFGPKHAAAILAHIEDLESDAAAFRAAIKADNEMLTEKDKRIAELEAENAEYAEDVQKVGAAMLEEIEKKEATLKEVYEWLNREVINLDAESYVIWEKLRDEVTE